jgi:flagellar hook-associated protein FlgK
VTLTDELINLKIGELQAGASARVIQTASDMLGSLIDIRV